MYEYGGLTSAKRRFCWDNVDVPEKCPTSTSSSTSSSSSSSSSSDRRELDGVRDMSNRSMCLLSMPWPSLESVASAVLSGIGAVCWIKCDTAIIHEDLSIILGPSRSKLAAVLSIIIIKKHTLHSKTIFYVNNFKVKVYPVTPKIYLNQKYTKNHL